MLRITLVISCCLLLAAVGLLLLPGLPREKAAPPVIPSLSAAENDLQPPTPVRITFLGDMMLAGGVGRVSAQHGGKSLLAGVAAIVEHDDLTIGNLECSVATTGKAEEKTYTFRAKPAVLAGLRDGGLDAVTLANNHVLDYGRGAFLETLRHLDAAGIAYAGAGKNLQAAWQSSRFTAGDKHVAFIAASRVVPNTGWHAGTAHPGVAAAYDPARLLAAIRAARQDADIVVVYLHWGVERAVKPESWQRPLAKKLIDAGADMVIGSHPHVLQGFEWYRGKLIAYSLGNFLFNNRMKATAMLRVTVQDGIVSAAVIPCRVVNYRPFIMTKPAQRQPVLDALQARSFDVHITPDGTLSAAE